MEPRYRGSCDFVVLQCIHLSLYCDAGERVLKQINLGIRSTVVFCMNYLKSQELTLTILSLVHYFCRPPLSHRPSKSYPTLLTHVLVYASYLCTLCDVGFFIYCVQKLG